MMRREQPVSRMVSARSQRRNLRPTMDPMRRTLLQVKIEDVFEADDVFTKLMGDDVEPRRDFIEKNALNVQNLDI